MEFSPLQYTGKVGDKVRDSRGHKSRKFATQIVKVCNMIVSRTFMIFVNDFPSEEVLVKVAKAA